MSTTPPMVSLAPNLCEDRKTLLADLIRNGFSKVEATFEGSGDEGWFDWIAVDGLNAERHETGKLGSFLHEVVNSVMPGWGDNEGGGGVIEWNLKADKISITGGSYERVRNDSSWAA